MKYWTAVAAVILTGPLLLMVGSLFFHTVCCQPRIFP